MRDGELSICGCCRQRQDQADYLRCEYGIGDFYRTFAVSELIDPDRITAEHKNGVLTVHLPKAEAAKPKRITVQAQ